MKFKQYLDEAKKLDNTMIGFGLDKKRFKPLSSYIKSWLIRYNIPYEEIKDPHFSIVQITGKYDKDELIREINDINKDIVFKPKELKIFRGKVIPKDFITIEYKPNNEFVSIFKNLESKYEIRSFPEIKPHISLFKVESNMITDKMFKDMRFSLPIIPSVKPANKELFNKKFEVEYKV